jgi:putative phosphoribosyl transferase
VLPPHAGGLVLFAHGLGSGPHDPRNERLTDFLHEVGFGTLSFSLLAPEEQSARASKARASLRTDLELAARRLLAVTQWVRQQPAAAELLIGYFGAGHAAAAALRAAAEESAINAIVTRSGRVGLPGVVLQQVRCPTLLIVGANDRALVATNLETWAQLKCEKSVEIIPGAGHRFEEPGALDNVSALAARWFGEHLKMESLA